MKNLPNPVELLKKKINLIDQSMKNLLTLIEDKREKLKDLKKKTRVFLAFLLVPFLVSQPCFCLVVLVNLTMSLAMGGAELTKKEVVVGLVRFF